MNEFPAKPVILLLVLVATSTAFATPPPPNAPPRTEPSLSLQVHEGMLEYTYDLSSLFDSNLWKVLEDNGFSEIAVEVRVRDAKEQVRVRQYHTLKIHLLESGRVRVMTSRRRGKIYPNRQAMQEALSSVRGRPIPATEFTGMQGHMELVALVNPVQVYAFPTQEGPLAQRQVVPHVDYDGKLVARSRAFRP